MQTLKIADLSATQELSAEELARVRGGADDQAIGTAQSNVQAMVAAANVGNGSLFAGPANIQTDNTFDQDADNRARSTNVDALLALGLGGGLIRR